MSKLPFTSKELEQEYCNVLFWIFDGLDYQKNKYIKVDKTYKSHGSRNYQRREAELAPIYKIYFNNRTLATVTKKPHPSIKLYEHYDQYRFPVKVLERVISSVAPQAKLERIYGE